MRSVTLGAVVLVACSLAPLKVVGADGTNEVSFKLYRSYVIVARGSIGNVRNLNFVIDTGAVPSILDRRIARRLHLTRDSLPDFPNFLYLTIVELFDLQPILAGVGRAGQTKRIARNDVPSFKILADGDLSGTAVL
jgi:hypothetical protein